MEDEEEQEFGSTSEEEEDEETHFGLDWFEERLSAGRVKNTTLLKPQHQTRASSISML